MCGMIVGHIATLFLTVQMVSGDSETPVSDTCSNLCLAASPLFLRICQYDQYVQTVYAQSKNVKTEMFGQR